MLRSELPAFPSFSGALLAAATVRSSAQMASGTYTPLGQEVARDVQQFIAQGAASASLAAMSSAQASWMAMQAARQLRQSAAGNASSVSADEAPPASVPSTPAARVKAGDSLPPRLTAEQQAFLGRIAPWAQQAAQRLGVSPRAVMAHAALESGWGQRPVRTEDGRDALNLFGIKATGAWQGARTASATHEFADGQWAQQTEVFRQYAGLDETFADYVNLLAHNPRYRAALNTGNDVRAFATALAQGGYATDPDYASKLERVSRSIRSAP